MITGLYQLYKSLNLDISFDEWKRKYFQKARLRVKKQKVKRVKKINKNNLIYFFEK